MAVPNVNQITSILRTMGDAQLKQYAAMHKNDPYILPMAIAESNARKQVRSQAQARMAAQPQQKVAEASIAEMDAPASLPENQGIAQLPAPNIQTMAGGGIVAFADGGETDTSTGVMRMADGGSIPRYNQQGLVRLPNESFSDYRRRVFEAELQAQQERTAAEESERAAERQRMLATRGENNMVPPSPFFERAPLLRDSVQAPAPQALASQAPASQPVVPRPTPSPRDDSFRRQTDPRMLGVSATPPAVPASANANTGANMGAATAGTNTPAQAGLGSLDVTKMTEAALKSAGEKPNPFAADLKKIGEEKVQAKESEAAGLEAIQKQFSDIYKGRKERLDKREGDIESMKDQGLGLAFLQAGAAMMTTRGGLGSAIGAGVATGTKQYALGLDKVRSAQEKLADARDRLEEIETNRNEMSARELNKARNEVKNAGIGAREDMLKANMQMYGVNRETALKMVDNQIKIGIMQTEQAGANARTQMQVGAPGATERLVDRMTKDPKFAEAYRNYASIGPEVKGDAAILAKYAGPQGEIALKMLESSGPDGKAQAQLIRQKLAASMLTPVSVANALP